MLFDATTEQYCVKAAHDAGLSVSTEELQQAANEFRARRGLSSARHTAEWLARQQLSVLDFEQMLESDLLFGKLKQHLASQRTVPHFNADPPRFARVHLAEVVVGSEGLARELLHQVHEEDAAFDHLARKHSIAPSRDQGGDIGIFIRAAMVAKVADAVFQTPEGSIAGPLLSSMGHVLYHVRKFHPAELDDATRLLIGREVFDAWLRERLVDVKIDLSFLEKADGPD